MAVQTLWPLRRSSRKSGDIGVAVVVRQAFFPAEQEHVSQRHKAPGADHSFLQTKDIRSDHEFSSTVGAVHGLPP